MRADNYREQEQRRADEQRQAERARARDPGSVMTPGRPAPGAAAALQADVDRAAALAQIERQASEKRVHVLQLLRCSQDPSVGASDAYAAQHAAAEAELKQLEARADALRSSARR
jgi:hypothetical protein